MTVEQLDAYLATPLTIARFAVKATKNGFDDAAMAMIDYALENPSAKELLAKLLTPVFGCDGDDDCDCPEELEVYRADLIELGKLLESDAA